MKCVLDVLAKTRIQETIVLLEQAEPIQVFWNAQRADRVPNADAFDRCILLAHVEAGERRGVLFLVRFPQCLELIEVSLADQTSKSDEATDATRRIGAARKSEEKDLIPLTIIRADERIGIAHVVREAGAGRTADNLAHLSAFGADARLVVHNLRGAILGDRFDGPGKTRDIGIVGALVRVVPAAVAANNQPLHRHTSHTAAKSHYSNSSCPQESDLVHLSDRATKRCAHRTRMPVSAAFLRSVS